MRSYESRYRDLTPRSSALDERARGLLPGGISHNLRRFDPYPLYAARAEGARVLDPDGNSYLDLWMGHYALVFGHAFPPVRRAVEQVLAGGWHFGMPVEAEVVLAERLRRAVPAMEKMRFCTSGTEATMYAVRLARGFTRKPWVLKAAGGWHGASTDLSFAVKPPFRGAEGPGLLPPREQGVDLIAFNDVEATERVVEAHRGGIAGIIVEPMLGSGGFLPADPAYLRYLREVCDREGAVLIFDEIITGFRFRYGTLADAYGVRPDLTTLGKIVGGGFPLGVYGGRREVMDAADPLQAKAPDRPVLVGGGTFSCHPVTLAAALATLEALEASRAELYPALEARGERLRRGVEERFAAAGVPAACTGRASLFMTHLLRGGDRDLRTPADLAAKTFSAAKDRELRLALLAHGVFAVHGGGALSAAHGEPELQVLLEAYARAAEDLAREGFEQG
ncbi:aspartate aminotransferase family protein [Deferrisoma camini]|uniref:aspartate aminotransferase family protein n=1 Tax=Deferrisoma camini TaxID=1035120 RepID=UPI0004A3FD84|nr:aminotransferase class III-fold pyridoxal phosphate-dependent enzyme [Deferrisoma camini]